MIYCLGQRAAPDSWPPDRSVAESPAVAASCQVVPGVAAVHAPSEVPGESEFLLQRKTAEFMSSVTNGVISSKLLSNLQARSAAAVRCSIASAALTTFGDSAVASS